MASGDGTTEIILGVVMTAVGFGSILLQAPVYCCGFAIFGPILFIVGLSKALRGPPRTAYGPPFYAPPYYGPPVAPPPAGVPPALATPQAPFPPPPTERKACAACGADNRGDAKFCTSCGTSF